MLVCVLAHGYVRGMCACISRCARTCVTATLHARERVCVDVCMCMCVR